MNKQGNLDKQYMNDNEIKNIIAINNNDYYFLIKSLCF